MPRTRAGCYRQETACAPLVRFSWIFARTSTDPSPNTWTTDDQLQSLELYPLYNEGFRTFTGGSL